MREKAKLFDYFGGKGRMTDVIQSLMPQSFAVYIEPFFGSGAVFLSLEKSRYKRAIVNDIDVGIVNLLRMLQDSKRGEILLERLKRLKIDEVAFGNAKYEEKHYFKGVDEITHAVMVYQLVSQSFNSTRKSFRRGMEQEKYTRQICYGVPLAMEKLRGNVQIENRDAIELIREFGQNERVFFFLDPPYVHSTRKKGARDIYKREMLDYEHAEFLRTVRGIKAKAMICGYANDLYSEMLKGYGWYQYEVEVTKPSANRKGRCAERATEVFWCNYEADSHQPMGERGRFV